MLKAASSFTLELEAAVNKLRLRQLVIDSWPCGILYIPVEIEICISYAFTKTHNLRRFVHVQCHSAVILCFAVLPVVSGHPWICVTPVHAEGFILQGVSNMTTSLVQLHSRTFMICPQSLHYVGMPTHILHSLG